MSKLILVTGASDGIGEQTALSLAKLGHAVIMHGRSPDKLQSAVDRVAAVATGPAPQSILADLSSLAQVRALADELSSRFPHLDVLLNNAGVFMNDHRLSADGYEMTFAVNHLAPFLLTHLLLKNLEQSAARVVNVSSVAHLRGKLDLDDLNAERGFDAYRAYALSKLANVLFTVELARRLGPSSSIKVNALHPGVVATKLLTEGFGIDGRDSLDEGAATSVYLATEPEGAQVTGRYFSACKQAKMHDIASDEAACAVFYERSAQLVSLGDLAL